MAHSPGPWRWNDDYIYDAHGYTVISGQEWSIANEDDRALVASAPDLAADLAEAVRLLRRVHWETANVTQDLSDGVNAFLARMDAR